MVPVFFRELDFPGGPRLAWKVPEDNAPLESKGVGTEGTATGPRSARNSTQRKMRRGSCACRLPWRCFDRSFRLLIP